jgi:hypothetical protein
MEDFFGILVRCDQSDNGFSHTPPQFIPNTKYAANSVFLNHSGVPKTGLMSNPVSKLKITVSNPHSFTILLPPISGGYYGKQKNNHKTKRVFYRLSLHDYAKMKRA